MRIIPAIDIINGRCVRLTQGQYRQQKTYRNNPLDMALEMEDHGLGYLHLIDLDGARSGYPENIDILEKIASATNLSIQFGGGLKTTRAAKDAFQAGAQRIIAGSIAVTHPWTLAQWLHQYGSPKIILAADCHNRQVVTHGWQRNSNREVTDFIKYWQARGIQEVICTDVSLDGTMLGPALELYEDILNNTTISLIASGGIAKQQDIKQLRLIGCTGAIIGKAIYEGNMSLKELAALC